MWSAIKTLLLVLLVSSLIWLWAEAESLSTQVLSPRLEPATGTDWTMRVGETDWTGSVRVRVRGSSIALAQARRLLAEPLRLAPGVGGVPADPGEHSVDLRAYLGNIPEIARLGVAVDEVDPPVVKIVVDRLATRTIPIRPALEGLEIDGEVRVDPAGAVVRAPVWVFDGLEPNATVSATPDEQALAAFRGDGPQSVRARLALPESLAGKPGVTISPQAARLTLKLRGPLRTITLARMPVQLVLPAVESLRYDVELLDPFVDAVKVTGPRDLVAALEERDAAGDRPPALLVLTPADLEKRVESKAVVFATTPSPLKFSAERVDVRIKISPRVVLK
jgi:hypothetical protein